MHKLFFCYMIKGNKSPISAFIIAMNNLIVMINATQTMHRQISYCLEFMITMNNLKMLNWFVFIIGMNDYYIIHCDDECKTIKTQINVIFALHSSSQRMHTKQFKHKHCKIIIIFVFMIGEEIRTWYLLNMAISKNIGRIATCICIRSTKQLIIKSVNHGIDRDLIGWFVWSCSCWMFYIENIYVIIEDQVNKKAVWSV